MGYLDDKGLLYLWSKIKTALSSKQDRLTGLPGQTVGFDESGNAKATEIIQGRTIELRGAEGAGKNYIDFHYDGSPEDYTARIIESSKGVIDLLGNFNVSGTLMASNIPHYFSNPNLIDNCDFQIWQRYPDGVYDGIPADIYIADRFKIRASSGSIKTIIRRIEGGGIFNEPSSPDCRIYYYMENAAQYSGQTMTLSVLKQSGLFTATGIMPELDETKDILSCSAFVDHPSVYWLNSGETIYRMKLELGDQQTLAHQDASGKWILNDPPPNKALELAKCQRYFFRLSLDSLSGLLIGTGYKISNEKAAITIVTPVEMRTRQAIRCNDISKLTVSSYISTFAKPTGLYLETKAGNQMRVSLSGDFKDFSYGVAILSADPDCCLDFDADL